MKKLVKDQCETLLYEYQLRFYEKFKQSILK